MKRTISLAICTMLLFTSFTGCSQIGLQGNVAVINNQRITRPMFDSQMNRMLGSMHLSQGALNSSENKPLMKMLQKITLQHMIMQTLVEQEAEKRKLSVTDAEVEQVLNKHIAEIGNRKEFEKHLTQLNMSETDFKTELKRQILLDKLVNSLGGNNLKVSVQEAQKFYNANPSQFDQPEQVRARHILVNADPSQIRTELQQSKPNLPPSELEKVVTTTMQARAQKANRLYEQARMAPQQFENLARENSDDKGSAKAGGDLGYFSREVMVKPFSDAAFNTKPGQVHEGIVQSPFGFHIIQVTDRRPGLKKSFNEVKGQLISVIENQRKVTFMEKWLENEKKKANIMLAPEFEALVKDPKLNPPETDSSSKAKSEQKPGEHS